MIKVIHKRFGRNAVSYVSKPKNPVSISHVMERPNVKRSIRSTALCLNQANL